MPEKKWPPVRPRAGLHAWPVAPTPDGAVILSLLTQLEESQWWPAERLRSHQLLQLDQLVRHAFKTVPFYRERLGDGGYDPNKRLSWERFSALPILTRGDLLEHKDALETKALPPGHGETYEIFTGGSTGTT